MNGRNSKMSGTPTPGTRQLALPIVDGLLPDAGDGKINLVPVEMLDTALPFDAPLWPDAAPTPESPEVLQGFWNEYGLDSVTLTSMPTPAELRLRVPTARLTEGVHELSYSVKIGEQGIAQPSQRLTLTIDRTVPVLADPAMLLFPQPVLDDGVTAAYLEDNGDAVEAEVPAYATPEVGDTITAYWDSAEGDDTIASSRTLQAADIGNPILLRFPGDVIRAGGDGTRLARYVVSDRAGNRTAHAAYAAVTVALGVEEEQWLAPPEFLPGDIADPADGTLNKDVIFAGDGLRLQIPRWLNLPIAGFSDMLYLVWARGDEAEEEFKVVLQRTIPGPPESIQFPIEITLHDTYLHPDGPFQLQYRVVSWSNEGAKSRVVSMVADSTPPWGTTDPARPGVPAEDITDAYLDANPQGVAWTLPAYEGFQLGDTVLYWWLNALPDDPVGIPYHSAAVTEVPMTLHVPSEAVRDAGDGGCYLVYLLVDKAGNRSLFSVYERVAVALGALPGTLSPPLLPQAEKGWIDLMDVHEGVLMAIPEFENWKPTDRIRMTWGSTTHQAEEIGTAPQFPLLIRVPDRTVQLEYEAAGVPGPVETAFSYRVLRGDVEFGPEGNTVSVDLSVIGPELPDWPDPVNPALGLAEVMGATSQILNTLTRADTGQDADFTFPLYAGAAAGDVVDAYWGTVWVEAARYTVTGAETPGDRITMVIPWAVIQAVGNQPMLEVHFRIGHPDSPNEQRSEMTVVSVDAVVITPPAPTFLRTVNDEGRMINCQSLDDTDDAVLVQVPDLSPYLAAGDAVRLRWTPYRGVQADDEITEAILEETITLTADQVAGFVWRVKPYDVHVLPTYDPDGFGAAGFARIHYVITYGGHELTSLESGIIVAMFNGVGSCAVFFDGEEA